MGYELFKGRQLLIATMHGKEKVMAPILEDGLGVTAQAISHFDTDQFGTFTGEVERVLGPRETLKHKLSSALHQAGMKLGVANEGSFGPHPAIPFIPADEEWALLIDLENGLELWGHHLTEETNYQHSQAATWQELVDFANSVDFPSHGVILRTHNGIIEKGITDWVRLKKVFEQSLTSNTPCQVETDMRAMFNPTRLLAIGHATRNLVAAANSCCPQCNKPGFIATEFIRGLPCRICHTATEAIKKSVFACGHCNFRLEKDNPFGDFTDPQYCPSCNP